LNYSFDHIKFIEQLLPGDLRTTTRKEWLAALLDPGNTLHSEFLSKVSEIRDEIALNGQKLTIEWYLNNLFDAVDRRIYIDDPSTTFVLVALYLISEGQDGQALYLISESPDGDGELELFLISEEESNDNDFTVFYPDTISPDLDAMNRAIKKIKKAAKRHNIDTFTP